MSDVELSDNFVGTFYLSDLTTKSYILNESLSKYVDESLYPGYNKK